MVLATQNPADLDYKALSNTSTWFLGRLQTERDKERVLEGLESLSGAMRKRDLDRTLSALGKRVFLLHNVHEAGPVVFHTRWAMSYLRGPLARAEIQRLMDPLRDELPGTQEMKPAPVTAAAPQSTATKGAPVLAPGIDQYFLPPGAGRGLAETQPGLLGMALMYFTNRSKTLEHREDVTYWLPLATSPEVSVDWLQSEQLPLTRELLLPRATPGVTFGQLPAEAGAPEPYGDWQGGFRDHLYRNRRVKVLRCADLEAESNPGEDERDQRAAQLRQDYADRRARLEERIARAEAKVEQQKAQARDHKLSTLITAGSTLLSAILGRKRLSRSTVSEAQTAMRRAGRSRKEVRDVELAADSMERLEADLRELERELERDLERMEDKLDPLRVELETLELRPLKRDIQVTLFGLGWRL